MAEDDRDFRDLLRATKAFSRSPGEKANFQRQFETVLEMAERHVAEGEIRVARQRDIVTHLRGRGADSALAESLLTQFEDTLAQARIHLSHLTGKSRGASADRE